MTIEMMRHGWFAPNLNLSDPDPRCGENNFIMGDGAAAQVEFAMSNNFAFGGVNTSLIFRQA
jgi:3-oxoacyl-[acyl-carrier-protein] synthase II